MGRETAGYFTHLELGLTSALCVGLLYAAIDAARGGALVIATLVAIGFTLVVRSGVRAFRSALDSRTAAVSVFVAVARPYETVAGNSLNGEVVLVFWWHLVPARGGGFEPDSVRVTGITL